MMKDGRILTLLTLVNLGILGFLLFHEHGSLKRKALCRSFGGSGLEIVDGQGKVRSSIQLVPEGPAIMADGSVRRTERSTRKQCSFG